MEMIANEHNGALYSIAPAKGGVCLIVCTHRMKQDWMLSIEPILFNLSLILTFPVL